MNLGSMVLLAVLVSPTIPSAPKYTTVSEVTACVGDKDMDYVPVTYETGTRTVQAAELGRSYYVIRPMGPRCLFYTSKRGGKVIWQTRHNEDGTFTAWVLQGSIYRKYDDANVTYENEIRQSEDGKEVLVFLLRIVNAKGASFTRDTASFTFDMAPVTEESGP